MDPVDRLITGISNISLDSTPQTSSSIIPYYPEGTDFLTIVTKELQKAQYTADPKFANLTPKMVGKFYSTIPSLGKGPNGHDIIKLNMTPDQFYLVDVEYFITFTDNLHCREELPIRFKTSLKLPYKPLGLPWHTSFAIERRKRTAFLFSIAYRQYQYEKLRAGTTPLLPTQVKSQRNYLIVKPEECYRVKHIKALEGVRYPDTLNIPNESKPSTTGFTIEGKQYYPHITYLRDIINVKERFPLSNACQVDLKNLHASLEINQDALLHQIYQINLSCEFSDTAVRYAYKITELFKDRVPTTPSEIELCQKNILDITNEYSCFLKKFLTEEQLSKAISSMRSLTQLLFQDFWTLGTEAIHRVTPEVFSGRTGHAESDYVVANDYATNWGPTVSSTIRDGAGNVHVSVSTVNEAQWLYVYTANSVYKSMLENEKTVKEYENKLLKYKKNKLTDEIKKKIETSEHVLKKAYVNDSNLRKIFDDVLIHKQTLIPTCETLARTLQFIVANKQLESAIQPPIDKAELDKSLTSIKNYMDIIKRRIEKYLKEYNALKSKLPAPPTPVV